jgi:hypothetical protein
MTLGWEAAAALAVGLFLLVLVLQPLMPGGAPAVPMAMPPDEGLEADETVSGIAVAALREIEFDRATGKLSDADYDFLKARYTARALDALRQDDAAPAGGLEAMVAARVAVLDAEASVEALFDSITGEALGTGHCRACGAPHARDAYFCERCGEALAGR